MFSKSPSNKAVSSECGELKENTELGGFDNWVYVNLRFIENKRAVEPLATSSYVFVSRFTNLFPLQVNWRRDKLNDGHIVILNYSDRFTMDMIGGKC